MDEQDRDLCFFGDGVGYILEEELGYADSGLSRHGYHVDFTSVNDS